MVSMPMDVSSSRPVIRSGWSATRAKVDTRRAVQLTRLATPKAVQPHSSRTRLCPRASSSADVVAPPPSPFPTRAVGSAGREVDPRGLERLPLREEGWEYWEWSYAGKSHRIHYIQEGEQGSPVVLVHGFGAHAYHWRYTVPALAKKHRVYSICLLGYGWSDKAVVDYSGETWAKQVRDFCREVVGTEEVTLVGNSIGCLACMAAAALMPRTKGLALLNSAGNPDVEEERTIDASTLDSFDNASSEKSLSEKINTAFGRLVAQGIFIGTKYRIKYFLDKVYLNTSFVDDSLIKSIFIPACDPQAPAAFFELSKAGGRTKFTLRGLLKQIEAQGTPMVLLWGQQDPWMKPDKAEKFVALYPAAQIVPLQSGHCPQDDSPEDVNASLLHFMEKL